MDEKNGYNRPNITITTTISPEFHALCKEKGWSWHAALAHGVMALKGEGNVKQEMQELHDDNVKIRNKLIEFKNREWELSERLKKAEEQIHTLGGKVEVVAGETKEGELWQN